MRRQALTAVLHWGTAKSPQTRPSSTTAHLEHLLHPALPSRAPIPAEAPQCPHPVPLGQGGSAQGMRALLAPHPGRVTDVGTSGLRQSSLGEGARAPPAEGTGCRGAPTLTIMRSCRVTPPLSRSRGKGLMVTAAMAWPAPGNSRRRVTATCRSTLGLYCSSSTNTARLLQRDSSSSGAGTAPALGPQVGGMWILCPVPFQQQP